MQISIKIMTFSLLLALGFMTSWTSTVKGGETDSMLDSLNKLTEKIEFKTSHTNPVNKMTSAEKHQNSFVWSIEKYIIVVKVSKKIEFYKEGKFIDKNIENGVLKIDPAKVDLKKTYNDDHRIYLVCRDKFQCMTKEYQDIWFNSEGKKIEDKKKNAKPLSEGFYIDNPVVTLQVKNKMIDLIKSIRKK